MALKISVLAVIRVWTQERTNNLFRQPTSLTFSP